MVNIDKTIYATFVLNEIAFKGYKNGNENVYEKGNTKIVVKGNDVFVNGTLTSLEDTMVLIKSMK